MQGSSHVSVVALTVVGDGLDGLPFSWSLPLPQNDLTSGAMLLWPGCRGCDQTPGLPLLNVEGAHVVVVPCRCDVLHGPGTVPPMSHTPEARTTVWAGLMMITDEMEDDRLTRLIQDEVLEVNQAALCLIIFHAGRMAEIG